jgi:hypothetical protein
VYFWLWRGQADSINYCDCYRPRSTPDGGYDYTGICP